MSRSSVMQIKQICYFWVLILSFSTAIYAQDHSRSAYYNDFEQRPVMLVGVNHTDKEIMRATSREFFASVVMPELGKDAYPKDKTIVIMEGITDQHGLYDMTDFLQQSAKVGTQNFPKGIAQYVESIILADYRSRKVLRFEEMFDQAMLKCIDGTIDPDVDQEIEIAELFKPGTYRLSDRCENPAALQAKAKVFAHDNQKLEVFYTQLAKAYADQGYRVIIMMDVLHALRVQFLMADYPHDYALFSDDFARSTRWASNYTAIDQIAMSEGALEQFYMHQYFSFRYDELPTHTREVIRNLVFENERSMIIPQVRHQFDKDASVMVVEASRFDFITEPKTGDTVLFYMADQSTESAQYLACEDHQDKGSIDQIKITLDGIIHMIDGIPVKYLVVGKDSTLDIDQVVKTNPARK
ncbi:MAG: hypothetical protein KDK51_05005 [Deltaproteobacteria bacterium]|nr:hypothetical protein [Deltaproteobacteria bacterium]